MRKGFTLVELLAVIVVLSVLAGLVLFSVNSVITNSKKNLSKNQIATIEKAAQNYYLKEGINEIDYDEIYNDDCVSLDYLIDNGYIDDEKIENFAKNKNMSGHVKITYKSNQYNYEYKEGQCEVSDDIKIASGFYDVDGNMLFTWEELLKKGYVKVKNGVLTSDYDEEELMPGEFSEYSGKLVIDKSVTSIADSAFYSYSNLTEVLIPGSVKTIGDSAFADCYSLTNVEMSTGVKVIEDSAFNFSSLTTIKIPKSVKTIGDSVFNETPWLKSKQQENPLVIVNNTLIDGTTATGDVVIPTTVTRIASGAFYESTVDNITIPTTVTSIGDYAFTSTPWLTTKQQENPIVIINNILVDGTTATGDVVIPDNVNYILAGAFQNSSITSIVIPDGITEIRDSVFSSCKSLKNIKLPNSVTKIGIHAFSYSGITDITLPKNLTYIDTWAFYYCEALTNIEIPYSVTYIGTWAFNGCKSLTSIEIKNKETYIEGWAFSGCKSLKIAKVSAKTLSGRVFEDCTSLTNITLDIEDIEGNDIFENCTSLKTVTFTKRLKTIGCAAFREASSITTVNYEGTENEWNNVFIDCTSWNSSIVNATKNYNYEIE